MQRPYLLIALNVVLLACGCKILAAESVNQRFVANPNQTPAGSLQAGYLTIRMEAAMGEWHPEEDEGPGLPTAAFREKGGPLSTPGPLLRMVEGTEIDAIVFNRLGQPLTLHGMHSRPGNPKDILIVPPGESREVKFLAGTPGTYFYWGARNGADSLVQRRAEDGQLNGAFIIDPKGTDSNAVAKSTADRTLVITDWRVIDDETTLPPKSREVLGINGLSWPHTERLTYRVGETVHWHVINASSSNHPMHLHGFYFRVDSVGDVENDILYSDDQRRMAVTELLRPGRTFTMTWVPDRPGNWLFHCHVLPHISPERRFWQTQASSNHSPADHARNGMFGLVTGITILPGDVPVRPQEKSRAPTRNMELVASELPGGFGKDPGMAFAIPKNGSELQPTIPGPPIVLTQGEPAAITVVNRLAEPLAVHWHGIELESYFDGVAGVSGSGDKLMRPIEPGASFVAQMTPPRAGTFIYHTHMDDIKQLSSGLYGALIVLPPGEKFDPENDRVLVISRGGPGETPIWLNGSRSPKLASFKAGQKYRLRIINIVPENPPVNVSLQVAGVAANWRPIAKDGADLPAGQRAMCPAHVTIGVGETYDFEFNAERAGELALEVIRPANRFPAEITPSHKVVEFRPESKVAVDVAVVQ